MIGTAVLALSAVVLTGCNGAGSKSGGVDPNETAATVNGKAIKLEAVERVLKQQAQGQESKLSPLELAQLRLQILDTLIQDEVLYQKAEKEGTVPSEEEVTAEFNRIKTSSGKTQEQFDKELAAVNETEASAKETIKKQLAVKKLEDKITGLVEAPREGEITAFYEGNKSAFVKRKGAKIAAIVVDPTDNGGNDVTKSEADAVRVANEILGQLKQDGNAFSQIARERSEERQSGLQGGELGYLSVDQLSQLLSPEIAAGIMNSQVGIGSIFPARAQGRLFIIKLQERSDKDEDLTLESPGVKEQVTESLISARKQLLISSFAAVAMNEAKIENLLAKKVISNPNELSGARPAGAGDAPATNANTAAPAANANTAAPAAEANTASGETKK